MSKPILKVFAGQVMDIPPVWLMRQAGRYLPEYRALRSDKGGFMDMVLDPNAASEVTMQPIRRFRMDGAILFSDILVVPYALGQDLAFREGEGPQLAPAALPDALSAVLDRRDDTRLNPIYETVAMTRAKLLAEGFDDTALIGFAGSPWTIACYMLCGNGHDRDFMTARVTALQNPEFFNNLIETVTDATIEYLAGQIDAGAEAVQLFDSWAGLCDGDLFNRFVINPTLKIATSIKTRYPHISVIGFPRLAGSMIQNYAVNTGIDVLAIDHHQNIPALLKTTNVRAYQGGLDPARLVAGGHALESGVDELRSAFAARPFVFNLGHGIVPQTPPEYVAALVERVRHNAKR